MSTAIGTVVVPIVVHVVPSVDQRAVNVSPWRASWTHPGAAPAIRPACALEPPVAARYCIATPFAADTTASTCLDPADVVSRNMTPALAHELVFVRLRTRAVIVPSPCQFWKT